jgi:hypothetical protein
MALNVTSPAGRWEAGKQQLRRRGTGIELGESTALFSLSPLVPRRERETDAQRFDP